jgi:L-arabinose isomerase
MTLNPTPPDRLIPDRRLQKAIKVGLVAGGLGTYWPQFPNLLPQLQSSARFVSEQIGKMDVELVDVGFISDAQELLPKNFVQLDAI